MYLYVISAKGKPPIKDLDTLLAEAAKGQVKLSLGEGQRGTSEADHILAAMKVTQAAGRDSPDEMYWVLTDYELGNLGAIKPAENKFVYVGSFDRPTLLALLTAEFGVETKLPKAGYAGIRVDHKALVDGKTFKVSYGSGHMVDER